MRNTRPKIDSKRQKAMSKRTVLAAIAVVGLGLQLLAQAPAPDHAAFEVASLKMATPGMIFTPTYGRNIWTVRNAPLGWLLNTAFDYDNKSIIGAPDWLRTEAYTID